MSKKRFYFRLIAKLVIIGIFVAIDLLTKFYFETYYKLGGEDYSLINGVLGITNVKNTGGAFGMLSSNTTTLIIFTVLFLCVFGLIDAYTTTFNGFYFAGFTLIVGGALGNFIDRISLGYVRDFIKLEFMEFPVFNFADMFLTVGVIFYVIYLVFYEMLKPKQKRAAIDE